MGGWYYRRSGRARMRPESAAGRPVRRHRKDWLCPTISTGRAWGDRQILRAWGGLRRRLADSAGSVEEIPIFRIEIVQRGAHAPARRGRERHFRLYPSDPRLADIGDELAGRGPLREGAKTYAKDFGQRYSPVRLMCSQPSGETWARRSGATAAPLAARLLTTSPSFIVFQKMMMAASRFMPAMR